MKNIFSLSFLHMFSNPLYLLLRCFPKVGKSENVCKYKYKWCRIMRFKKEEACFLVMGIIQSPNHLLLTGGITCPKYFRYGVSLIYLRAMLEGITSTCSLHRRLNVVFQDAQIFTWT